MTTEHPGYLLIERAAAELRVTRLTQDECRQLMQYAIAEAQQGRDEHFVAWLKSKFEGRRRKSRLYVQICDMFHHAGKVALIEEAEEAAVQRARELYGTR